MGKTQNLKGNEDIQSIYASEGVGVSLSAIVDSGACADYDHFGDLFQISIFIIGFRIINERGTFESRIDLFYSISLSTPAYPPVGPRSRLPGRRRAY